jgi:hypothetical protein
MDTVFALALMAGSFLTIKVLWFPPSWLGRAADAVARRTSADDGERSGAPEDRPGQGEELGVDWELLRRTSIRRRLDALAEELERLDRDPDVFAKAFHTMVARSAHEALLSDASRLGDPLPRFTVRVLDLEVMGPSMRRGEELEL